MTTAIICSRCQAEKPPMPNAPMGGPVGQELVENVCAECWAEWRDTSGKLINHYGLVLGNPEHRTQLRAAMREFLSLDNDDDD